MQRLVEMLWLLVTLVHQLSTVLTVVQPEKETDHCLQNSNVNVSIDIGTGLHSIDDKFLSVALDSSLIREKWGKLDFESRKIQVLAKGLSPSFLRVGGTAADLLIFEPELNRDQKPPIKNFTLSETEWNSLNKFVGTVGWDLIFGLNVLLRRGNNWDSTNAVQLLKYTLQNGFPLAGLELGNEPNAFHHVFGVNITSEQLAGDFASLAVLTQQLNLSAKIWGPDVTQVVKKSARRYFDSFLASGGNKVISVATFHHYYLDGRIARQADFMDVQVMESLLPEIRIAQDILAQRAPHVPLWLGETSSAYGGGAPGLSDRYVAGFLWLDKLGVAAKAGMGGVVRQSFYKGDYALLSKYGDPNPDYWLTLLYKRLVGSPVLKADNSDTTGLTRSYAHCSRNHSGGVVVYAMNLHNEAIQLFLPDFSTLLHHVYLLTPPEGDLTSSAVLLNGQRLEMAGDELPPLVPLVQKSPVQLPAHTFALVELPDAQAPACLHQSRRRG